MNTTELIVSIVVGIGCCALGMFLGSMPLKREQITEEQNKYQQLGGLLACGLVVILMLLSMDIASWVAIAALAVGVGICVEKGFQPGGAKLRERGVKLVSLAVVDAIDNGKIILRD